VEVILVELRHLQTFQTVLREGSFLAAARALRVAQPTVTLHVQELEAELGLVLFDRTGRERRPTEAGALLTERALPILDAVDALRRSMAELREGACGVLRFAAIEPAASRRVTPLLGRLRAERPGLRIQLVVSGTGGVSRAVADGDVDIGLCSPPPEELRLRFEPLFVEEMAFLVPVGHRLARAATFPVAELDGEPLALTARGCAYRRAVEAALDELGVRPQWSFESDSSGAVRAAPAEGLGIAVLPLPAATPPPDGTVLRRATDLAITLPVGLVTRPATTPPPPSVGLLLDRLRCELAGS
jgi:DNA-binding transcriptional LysR family regulator